MARTRRALIDAVLDNLGVLIPGQAPGSEIVERVDNIIDPVLAELAALGTIYVADAGESNPPSGGEIEDAIFVALADRVAWAIAGAFNLADSPALKTLSDQADKTLRLIGRPASTRRTLGTDVQLHGGTSRTLRGNFTTGT